MINQSDALSQMLEAMSNHGLTLSTGRIVADGKIHRCDVASKGKSGVGDGSYLLHLHSNYAVGGYQNWITDREWQKWKYERPGWQPTPAEQREMAEEIERARTKAERELAIARTEARQRGNRLWKQAEPASRWHPYLERKQVKPYGLKAMQFKNGERPLLVPMYNAENELVNLQYIYADGRKRGLKGGVVADCRYWIKGLPKDTVATIYLCEGYATGATIRQVINGAVVLAFNCHNLRSVASWLRQRYPEAQIVVCADDDWRVDGNPGRTAANEAARAVGGLVAMPVFDTNREDKATDFNDMQIASGLDAVKQAIDAATAPPEPVVNEQEAEAADSADPTQTNLLIQLASTAQLFHNGGAYAIGFADLNIADHRETWPIRSRGFKDWLLWQYFRATKGAPNPTALASALRTIEAKAKFDGPEREIFLRVGGHDGRTYLDLCAADWNVVEIGPDGWRIIDDAPVRFIRRHGMQALPEPTRDGSLATLRDYLNVKSDDAFILVQSWLLGALRPAGPYAAMEVTGEAGTAKSTLLRVVRSLIDPNKVPLRAPPREDRDLFVAAGNGYVPCFDNLSELKKWLSDSLARLATGGGFGTRMLYTDDDELLIDATRPVLLGAIEDVVTQGDLADRTTRLQLAPIPDRNRRSEREFWAAFDRDRPAILGGLLDAAAHGLRELPNTKLDSHSRMADHEEWVVACGDGLLWEAGAFTRAYAINRVRMNREIIEADSVAVVIRALMANRADEWSGTATELLERLELLAGKKEVARKDWPVSAAALGGRLRRIAPPLRRIGINVVSGRAGKGRTRVITLTNSKVRKQPSAPSASSAPSVAKSLKDKGGGRRTAADGFLRTTATADSKDRDDDRDDGAIIPFKSVPFKPRRLFGYVKGGRAPAKRRERDDDN